MNDKDRRKKIKNNSFRVERMDLDELPEHEARGWNKDDYINFLLIHTDGEDVYYSDHMEPEDANFIRDLSWVEDELIAAYATGFKHGRMGR